MQRPLERCTPEQQGISSQAILEFLDAVEAQVRDLHSFMLLRHGAVVAEGWWQPYNASSPHMLYSLSKSFTATAVGLAIAEDRLALDDPLITFFPEDLPAEISPNLAAMRVRHLLSMSTGHAENTSDHMMADPSQRWERAFLAQPVDFPPGTHFVYNNGATYMLSAILHKLTGQTLVEYLTPRLFEPLGIDTPAWETNPRGVTVGFKGLRLKTEDIARFGQLYLNRGFWQGQRILPEGWVELASSQHVENGGEGSPIDWSQGYGFQFWRCRHNAYRGDGAFGQYCIIMPEQDAVLAITSGLDNMQLPLDLVWKHLLPAMQPAPELPQAAPRTEASQADPLLERLSCLEIHPPRGVDLPAGLKRIDGLRYRLEPNYLGFVTLSFHSIAGRLTLETCSADGSCSTLECGLENWQKGITGPFLPLTMEMKMTSGLDERAPEIARLNVAASARWTGLDELELTARYYETPYVQTLAFKFSGSQLTLDTRVNVSFGPLEGPQITGRCE